MNEFGFLNINSDEIVLDDAIKVLESPSEEKFLIANSKELDAIIYAPEINFYLKNTVQNTLLKAQNSLKLYEIRATAFDMAKDVDFTKKIGKNIVLISNEEENSLIKVLLNNEFKVLKFDHNEIKLIYGAAGELNAIILKEDGEFELDFDLLLVKNAKEYMLRQSGCFEIKDLKNEEILNLLEFFSPNYPYKKAISYDSMICQYANRRSIHCSKCVDACPTVAIMKDDEKKELIFSDIDCVACGKCTSVCPSGSLEYNLVPRNSFSEIISFYEDNIVLLFDESIDIEKIDLKLSQNILPLALKSVNFLDQSHILSILQTTGANFVILAKYLGDGIKESVDLLNEIYEKIWQEKAVYLAKDEKELKQTLGHLKFISGSKYIIDERELSKREIFSKRLLALVKDNDYGKTRCGEWVRYGKITINQDSCTLCLSCIGACNTGALYADEANKSINFNASLCTTCGYCENSCAEENTLQLFRDGIWLNKDYFNYQILAKDEMFRCIQCNKEFATLKSIEKISTLLKNHFKDDPLKLKTIYCCADCKVKLMLSRQIEQRKYQ